MKYTRKVSLVAGLFYLLTFISIPTLTLYSEVHNPNYMIGIGTETPVLIGCILEVIVALAGIGTAVTLFPVVKRQNEALAIGFVGTRVLEAATIFVGVTCLLSVVTLRQSGVGANALTTGQALVAMYDRAFIVGQNLMPVMNALLLGSLLYQSRLVPRILPLLGFIGAPMIVAAQGAVLFGLLDRISVLAAIATIPIAVWEFSLGLWLTFKGFKPSPLLEHEH